MEMLLGPHRDYITAQIFLVLLWWAISLPLCTFLHPGWDWWFNQLRWEFAVTLGTSLMLEEAVGPTVNSVYKQVLFNNCENCPPSSDLCQRSLSCHITSQRDLGCSLWLQRVIICLEHILTPQEVFHLGKLREELEVRDSLVEVLLSICVWDTWLPSVQTEFPSFQKEKVPEIPICGGLVGTDERSLRTWVILGKVSYLTSLMA